MCCPGVFKVAHEMLVVTLIGFSDWLSRVVVFIDEFLSFCLRSSGPVAFTTSSFVASFNCWLILISKSSEEPVIKAFGCHGLILWLFTLSLVRWRNSFYTPSLHSKIWSEGSGEVNVFLNTHLGVSINNLGFEKLVISLLQFLCGLETLLHNITGVIESLLVPRDFSDDWDLLRHV